MSVVVLKPGALTTVQDRGRTGFRHLGVGLGGALDEVSSSLANWLAGNEADAALLEITLTGPTLRFDTAARIALGGARIDASVDGQVLPTWRPIDLPAGAELRLGACRAGARAYLAVDGGFAATLVMGSRATDVRGGFGGSEGRALRVGDRLALDRESRAGDRLRIAGWWIDPAPDLDIDALACAQVLPGRDALEGSASLSGVEWRAAAASDRQGLRLHGPALRAADRGERLSAPVVPGCVQLPPDGQPIVLLGEAQTVGGYPVIGHVARVDLPRLAQCRPGDLVRFEPGDLASALARLQARAHRMERRRIAISQALSR